MLVGMTLVNIQPCCSWYALEGDIRRIYEPQTYLEPEKKRHVCKNMSDYKISSLVGVSLH